MDWKYGNRLLPDMGWKYWSEGKGRAGPRIEAVIIDCKTYSPIEFLLGPG